MNRYACIFAMVLTAWALPAESVWTGNAAVGGMTQFPGDSSVYRAASNSFPPGTILKVTNPRGGRSVEVTVMGRLESPGVFLLVEERAAENIGLPLDHVMPVRVTPLDAGSGLDTPETTVHSGTTTDDSDFNPAASIAESDVEPRTIAAPVVSDVEPDRADAIVEDSMPDDGASTEAESKIVKKTPAAEPNAAVEPVPIPVPDPDPAVDPETIYTYDLSGPDPAPEPIPPLAVDKGTLPEPKIDPAPLPEIGDEPDPENAIFFLMPSDPRPPEPILEPSAAGGTMPEVAEVPAVPEAAAIPDGPLPAMDESTEALVRGGGVTEGLPALNRAVPGDGHRYIQIGAYRSRAVLNDSARRIAAEAPGYPLSIAEETDGTVAAYKLLIGPLRPAETGIVLQTARSSAFPDAFPYRP